MQIELTVEEIGELFSRCLSSPMEDTPTSVSALQKLAEALENHGASRKIAA